MLSIGLLVFFLLPVLVSPALADNAARIRVAVSIVPQIYFVERIGGNRVDVQAIMPKYVDHDTFEPTPRQLKDISKADLYIKIGIEHFQFEPKYVDPLVNNHPNLKVVNMSEGIRLLPDDPHIWIAPPTVKASAQTICKALSARYPADAPYFRKNLEAFIRDIDALDGKIRALLAAQEGKSFLIFHPALGYFAEHYHLKQLVIEKEGKSPSALHLRRLSDRARAEKIPAILVQKGFDHKSAATLAAEFGGRLLEIDPMEKDWLKNTWQLAEKVREAMAR